MDYASNMSFNRFQNPSMLARDFESMQLRQSGLTRPDTLFKRRRVVGAQLLQLPFRSDPRTGSPLLCIGPFIFNRRG